MRDLLEALWDAVLRRGVDFIFLQDGRADKVNQYRGRGLGLRVLLNRAWGFASTNSYERDQAFDCLETAAKMGVAPNGSARAQGFSSRPIVRMSNTFIAPGRMSFEELLKDIDLGVYLRAGEWGYVFCERGQYTCPAGEDYLIRHGELAEHLQDASISGLTLETLLNADAVSSDFELNMPGMCGKSGQGIYINAGGPHVRVREVVVGGQG